MKNKPATLAIINNPPKRNFFPHVILCLLSVSIMPIYLYGTRVIILILTAVATSIITDYICTRISPSKHWEKNDLSFIVTALVTALLLPATAPPWLACVSVFIAIVIAKHPFGGNGYTIFNPAAVGLAFCAICWPEYALRYPTPGLTANVVDETMLLFSESPASILRVGGTPKIDYFDVFLGKFAGPMGATCMLVLAACLLYLFLRGIASLKVVLPALTVVGLFAVLFPRISTGEWSSLLFEGCSGALIFGLIFMANDPVTLPKTGAGKLLYGTIIGFCVVLFRRFGQVELEFVYALLIANIFAIPCDRYANHIETLFHNFTLKRKLKKENPVDTELPSDQPIAE